MLAKMHVSFTNFLCETCSGFSLIFAYVIGAMLSGFFCSLVLALGSMSSLALSVFSNQNEFPAGKPLGRGHAMPRLFWSLKPALGTPEVGCQG